MLHLPGLKGEACVSGFSMHFFKWPINWLQKRTQAVYEKMTLGPLLFDLSKHFPDFLGSFHQFKVLLNKTCCLCPHSLSSTATERPETVENERHSTTGQITAGCAKWAGPEINSSYFKMLPQVLRGDLGCVLITY